MLEEAVAAAVELRDVLAEEIEQAREERQLFRRMEARRLFERATSRATFSAEVARLERAMALALSHVAQRLGLAEISLADLAQRAPAEAAPFSRTLGDIRALVSALRELDQLNLFLAGRALTCVRGYVNALSPAPAAYDRRGTRATAAAAAVVSNKV